MKKKTGKHIFEKITRYLLLSVCSILIGISIYSFNAERILGNQMPMPFGFGMAVVMSGSMEPALMTGDLVIVREYDPQKAVYDDSYRKLCPGEIIVYISETGRSLVIHRIEEIREDDGVMITRGDANSGTDAPVPFDRVKGTYLCRIPKAGNVLLGIKNPVCALGLLITAFLLLEISYLNGKKEEDEELQRMKQEIQELKKDMHEE